MVVVVAAATTRQAGADFRQWNGMHRARMVFGGTGWRAFIFCSPILVHHAPPPRAPPRSHLCIRFWDGTSPGVPRNAWFESGCRSLPPDKHLLCSIVLGRRSCRLGREWERAKGVIE